MIKKNPHKSKDYLNIKYLKKIPYDVIINYIIPYSYNIQSKKLTNDIKNYFQNFIILENIYEAEYNYFILYYDLIEFCNKIEFLNIIKRHYLYKNYSEYLLNYYILNIFTISSSVSGISGISTSEFVGIPKYTGDVGIKVLQRSVEIDDFQCKKKIRFLWGLLKPIERIKFMKKYINISYSVQNQK